MTQTARGSTVTAGGNATIGATRTAGASKDSAQDSSLTIQGRQTGKHATVSALFVCQSRLSSVELQCSP